MSLNDGGLRGNNVNNKSGGGGKPREMLNGANTGNNNDNNYDGGNFTYFMEMCKHRLNTSAQAART